MKLIRQGRYSPAWAGTTEQRSEAYKGAYKGTLTL